MLQDKREFVIQAINEGDQSIVVFPPGKFLNQDRFVHKSVGLCPIHVDTDTLWVETVEGFAIGDVLTQQRHLGTLPELFAEFQNEWVPRWQRHLDIPADQWSPILQFIEHAIPTRKCTFAPLSIAKWEATVKSKKKRAATGPDGVSRQDMLHMPSQVHQELIGIAEDAEAGKGWPTQALVGLVSSLEKRADANKASEYRPICIFSFYYRCWASIRARQCLAAMSDIAPASVCGSMPGRSATSVWYNLLEAMEFATYSNQEANGAVLDIIKCFNTLPRLPVFAASIKLGIPDEVIRVWSAGTSQAQRRFLIRGGCSTPLRAITGFAEGDPLSVVAMASLNFVLDIYMTNLHPTCRLYTFVDNIEVLTRTACDAIHAMNLLQNFCRLLDIQIDPKKSFAWSQGVEGRKSIKAAEIPVVKQGRDLGAHMNYGFAHTNATVVERCSSLKPKWQLLARSPSPYHLKKKTIRTSFWSKGLHGIEAVIIGNHHFEVMRTGAMRGLGVQKQGASPVLQLGCVEPPTFDPQFLALWQSLMSFRKHHTPDIMSFVFEQIAQQALGGKIRPGPYGALFRRLQEVGWSWVEGECFRDHEGREVGICSVPIQELRIRMYEAWTFRIACQVSVRATMKGIDKVDPMFTRRGFDKVPVESMAFLRTALNGTFFTNDKLHKAGVVETDDCEFCRGLDSQIHRHWECEAFREVRGDVSFVDEQRAVIPNCCLAHGWMPGNPETCFVRLKTL